MIMAEASGEGASKYFVMMRAIHTQMGILHITCHASS